MSDRVGFLECIARVWGDPELMAEYRRVYGSTIGLDNRAPIERLVDEATGHQPINDREVAQFLNFVWDCVWLRLPEEIRA